jgi:hypothetical protein
MSCTGTPSVMQTMNSIPASAASNIASAAKAGRDVDDRGVGAASLTASSTVLKIGTCPSNFWPPLPGVTPGDDLGAVLDHLPGVERAVAAGDALNDQAGVLVDEDAHLPSPFAS